MSLKNLTIVSGGQTGVDQAALDWAIAHGIPHGGWCPKGRNAEDGPIPPRYELKETPKADYLQRTEWNVRDSDGTVVFSISATLTGGSKKTVELAQRHQKPVIHLSQQGGPPSPEKALMQFVRQYLIHTLNVAGPRASNEPEVVAFVTEVLDKALKLSADSIPLKPSPLETPGLVLRPFTLGDAPVVAKLAGRREIADTTISIPHPYSIPQAIAWIASHIDPQGATGDIVFAITLRADGQLIGSVGLREIDHEHSQVEMGFWIGVEYWGKGYATEAARAVVGFAFEQLRLNRVHAHYMVRNPASGRVLQKIGMQQEGVLRQRVRKWGIFEDGVMMAMLRKDWAVQNKTSQSEGRS